MHPRWRRRSMLGKHCREPPEEPLRTVVGHRHQAAALGDPEQLECHPFRIRGEHGAEDRRHDVEALVRKREVLGVRLTPFDREAEGPGPSLAHLDHRRREVGGHHRRPEASRGNREVPVAGGDIEHLGSRLETAALGKLDRVRLQVGGDRTIVAERPHPADRFLRLRVVGHEQPPMRRRPAAPARRRQIRTPRSRWRASRSAHRRRRA